MVRRIAIGVAATLLILALLFLSLQPTVGIQTRPSTEDIQAARQVWQQVKLARGATTKVRVDGRMVLGLAAIARDATGLPRIGAALAEGELQARASIALPLGFWINTSAAARGDYEGFPPFSLKVGRVTLPKAAARPMANLARWFLRMKGATIPPLDEFVQNVSIGPDHVSAKVKLPTKTGLVDEVRAAASREISQELVGALFCQLATAQRKELAPKLPELVRRVFAIGSRESVEEFNAAAFVALSLAVTGERAEMLLPRGAEIRKRCPFPAGEVRLQGRADLAKHWVLSASLTSIFGAETAENLGEWKELDDSRADGSGFSFVDLAADRAGVGTANLALDPATAAATKDQLSRATEEYMLPAVLLQAPEGLSDASFVARFGSLEQNPYREAISQIDRILAQQRRYSK